MRSGAQVTSGRRVNPTEYDLGTLLTFGHEASAHAGLPPDFRTPSETEALSFAKVIGYWS